MATFALVRPARSRSRSPTAALLRNYEFWFVTLAVLLTAIIPGLSKYQSDDGGASTSANELLWSAMYLFAVVRLTTMRSTAAPLLRRSRAMAIFLVLVFATSIWSVLPLVTFKNAIELIGTTVIGYYIVTRFTLVQFMTILAVAFTVIGLTSVAFIFGAPAHGRMDWGAGAWSGIYQEKNNLAAVAALAIISQVLLLTQARGRLRAFVIAGMVLFCILLLGAQSATAFADGAVILLVPLIVLGWRSRKYGLTVRVTVAGGAVVLCVVVAVTGASMDTVFALLGRQSNLTGRADFWPYLQQAISVKPMFGYGYNAFFQSSVGSDDLAAYVIQAGGWTPYHAHNSFLQILLDAGYTGLLALIVLIVTALWRGIAAIRRERRAIAIWPLAVTLYLLLGSFTETYLARCNTLEWIIFVAALLYPLRESPNGPLVRRAVTETSSREKMRERLLARRSARASR